MSKTYFKHFIALSAAVLTLSAIYTSRASFTGSISFTPDEQEQHRKALPQIVNDAGDCLKDDYNHHLKFFKKYGISPFYGDQSSFAKLSYSEKQIYLARLGIDADLLSQMQPTSCVGMTLKCLGGAFQKNGESEFWNRIRRFLNANDVDGTALQTALQQLGWKILYWNPDTSQNEAWDARERSANPSNSSHFWGYHAYRWATVRGEGHIYYNSVVDDWQLLVDFKLSPPLRFRRIPFFVGTAHAGYHVFSGLFGEVIEGHSMRLITDPNTIERAEFNPLAENGAPRGPYVTGLAAVPPGY